MYNAIYTTLLDSSQYIFSQCRNFLKFLITQNYNRKGENSGLHSMLKQEMCRSKPKQAKTITRIQDITELSKAAVKVSSSILSRYATKTSAAAIIEVLHKALLGFFIALTNTTITGSLIKTQNITVD